MTFRIFSDAKTFVHSLNLKCQRQWRESCKDGKIPNNIPRNPIAPRNRKYCPFNEAREYARSSNLSDVKEWEKYCSSGKIPNDIRRDPERIYKDMIMTCN